MAAGRLTPLNILLVGKTGVGKSSTGNALLGGGKKFRTKAGKSVTKECLSETAQRDGLEVTVTDSPGLCDTDGDDVKTVIDKYVAQYGKGLHVICLVLSASNRPTKEEMEAVALLAKLFGAAMLAYLVIIVTREEELVREETSVKEFLSEFKGTGADLLRECIEQGRVHGIDNYNQSVRDRQVQDILRTALKVAECNKGLMYTATDLAKQREKLEEEKKALEEEKRRVIALKKRLEEEEIARRAQEEAEKKMREKEEQLRREQEEALRLKLEELERQKEEELRQKDAQRRREMKEERRRHEKQVRLQEEEMQRRKEEELRQQDEQRRREMEEEQRRHEEEMRLQEEEMQREKEEEMQREKKDAARRQQEEEKRRKQKKELRLEQELDHLQKEKEQKEKELEEIKKRIEELNKQKGLQPGQNGSPKTTEDDQDTQDRSTDTPALSLRDQHMSVGDVSGGSTAYGTYQRNENKPVTITQDRNTDTPVLSLRDQHMSVGDVSGGSTAYGTYQHHENKPVIITQVNSPSGLNQDDGDGATDTVRKEAAAPGSTGLQPGQNDSPKTTEDDQKTQVPHTDGKYGNGIAVTLINNPSGVKQDDGGGTSPKESKESTAPSRTGTAQDATQYRGTRSASKQKGGDHSAGNLAENAGVSGVIHEGSLDQLRREWEEALRFQKEELQRQMEKELRQQTEQLRREMEKERRRLEKRLCLMEENIERQRKEAERRQEEDEKRRQEEEKLRHGQEIVVRPQEELSRTEKECEENRKHIQEISERRGGLLRRMLPSWTAIATELGTGALTDWDNRLGTNTESGCRIRSWHDSWSSSETSYEVRSTSQVTHEHSTFSMDS